MGKDPIRAPRATLLEGWSEDHVEAAATFVRRELERGYGGQRQHP